MVSCGGACFLSGTGLHLTDLFFASMHMMCLGLFYIGRGGYGNDPGYFIAPSSICAFESVPKKMCDDYFDDTTHLSTKRLHVKVAVADPGNNRVQVLEHCVQFSQKVDMSTARKKGCCLVM